LIYGRFLAPKLESFSGLQGRGTAGRSTMVCNAAHRLEPSTNGLFLRPSPNLFWQHKSFVPFHTAPNVCTHDFPYIALVEEPRLHQHRRHHTAFSSATRHRHNIIVTPD